MGTTIESILQDSFYAMRMLRKSPAFTLITILTLALGMGLNAAIFSFVYAALLKPLPYYKPAQLGLIWSAFEKSGALRAPTSGTIVGELQRRSRTLQDVAGIWVGNGTFTGQAEPEQVKVAFVTPNFLNVLGVRPQAGRLFGRDERSPGKLAVILSDGLWRRRYGADPKIIGKLVRFEGADVTVIGVLAPQFRLHFPAGSDVPAEVQAFMPFFEDISKMPVTLYYIRVLTRLKTGVSFAEAQRDMNEVAGELRHAYHDYAVENLKLEIAPMQLDAVRDLRPALLALFAGAALVYLICCINVANLLLARRNERSSEIALRAALGASNARIARQFLMEILALCVIAGFAGAALGWLGVRVLALLRPDYLARVGDFGIGLPVLGFVAAISISSVLLFGLAPFLKREKPALLEALRTAGGTQNTGVYSRARNLLLAAEISLGFVLIIGAGLMIRTFLNVSGVHPGFQPQHLLTFQMELPESHYGTQAACINFVRNWERRLRMLPGVQSVGATSHLPLDDYPNWYSPYRPAEVPQAQASGLIADHRCITPQYLEALGTRLLEGREFNDHDQAGTRRVVIVDELLARSAWPGRSAIGRQIYAEHLTDRGFESELSEVVGVAEHVRNHSLSKEVRPEIYIPYTQSARPHLGWVVRSRQQPLALVASIRNALRQQDRELALAKVQPMTEFVRKAATPISFSAFLATVFASLALVLAAIGIYGVTYYLVSRKTREFGIRVALGATSRNLLSLVLFDGLKVSAAGIALGLAAALFISRLLKNQLYGVSELDPVTYAIALGIVPALVLIACWRPARRASKVNAVDAIRQS